MNARDWAKATYPPSTLSIGGCANSRSGQVLDPFDKSFDDGLGLLGDQGVARVRNDRYCDARTELVFHFVALGLRLERVVRGLQLQERRRAAGPPLVLLDRGNRGALAVADFKVPALQPDGRIVARRKERKAQRGEALFIRKRKVAGLGHCSRKLRRILLGWGRRDHHAPHQGGI